MDTLSTRWAGRRRIALQEEKQGQSRGGCYAGCMAMWEGGKGGSCREISIAGDEPGEGGSALITPTPCPRRPARVWPHRTCYLIWFSQPRSGAIWLMNSEGNADSKRESHLPGHTAIRCAPAAWLP